MGKIEHGKLAGNNLHTQLVDTAGDIKIDTNTAGDNATVRFLESNNKKMVWNYAANKIEFYINASTIGVTLESGATAGGGCIGLKETTTPTAVDSYGKIYFKSDNLLYAQDGAGVEHVVTFTA